jgi:coproporphyrinogen III oxidase-like Fe-S oxidoreductase
MDATFNSKRQRAKNILSHVVELRKKHKSRIAISTEMFPELMDEEMLVLARDANMNYLEIGIQTLNPRALEHMDRPRKGNKLKEMVDLAIKHDVRIVPQLILGAHPGAAR